MKKNGLFFSIIIGIIILIEVPVLVLIASKIYGIKQYQKQLDETHEVPKQEAVLEDDLEIETDPEPEDKIEESSFVQADVIQEYKGKIYTVYDVNTDAGIVHVPDGDYVSLMAIYKDFIYYTSPGGTGMENTEIYRMNLDGTDKSVLVADAAAYDMFCIYNDVLYYDVCYADGKQSRSVDLNTMQINAEEYYFIEGNEKVWIASADSWGDKAYVCNPGYENMQTFPPASQMTGQTVLGIKGEDIYYLSGVNIVKTSFSSIDIENEVISEIVNTSYQPKLLGDGIYYQTTEDEYLHRYDLKTGIAKAYNIKGMIDEWEWGWWLTNEINGNLYFEEYVGENSEVSIENTEFWELNLETGNARSIGRWFES